LLACASLSFSKFILACVSFFVDRSELTGFGGFLALSGLVSKKLPFVLSRDQAHTKYRLFLAFSALFLGSIAWSLSRLSMTPLRRIMRLTLMWKVKCTT
jgi:hypothetical protein